MRLITDAITEMAENEHLDDAGQALLEHAAVAVGLATAGKDPLKIARAVKVLLACMLAYGLVRPAQVPKTPDEFETFLATLTADDG